MHNWMLVSYDMAQIIYRMLFATLKPVSPSWQLPGLILTNILADILRLCKLHIISY